MNFRILYQAQDEFDASVDRYESLSPGLGSRFKNRVARRFRELVATPRLYGEVSPRVRRREIRQAPVTDFPYTVIYAVRPGEVLVIAVANNSLRPYYWRRRLV